MTVRIVTDEKIVGAKRRSDDVDTTVIMTMTGKRTMNGGNVRSEGNGIGTVRIAITTTTEKMAVTAMQPSVADGEGRRNHDRDETN